MKGSLKKHAILAKFDAGGDEGYPNAIAQALGCNRSYVHSVLKKERHDYKLTLAQRRLKDAEAMLGGSE